VSKLLPKYIPKSSNHIKIHHRPSNLKPVFHETLQFKFASQPYQISYSVHDLAWSFWLLSNIINQEAGSSTVLTGTNSSNSICSHDNAAKTTQQQDKTKRTQCSDHFLTLNEQGSTFLDSHLTTTICTNSYITSHPARGTSILTPSPWPTSSCAPKCWCWHPVYDMCQYHLHQLCLLSLHLHQYCLHG
jgi:hypothetical protein